MHWPLQNSPPARHLSFLQTPTVLGSPYICHFLTGVSPWDGAGPAMHHVRAVRDLAEMLLLCLPS